MTVQQALEKSVNLVTLRVLQAIGTQYAQDFVTKKVDLILCSPFNKDALLNAYKSARSAGIPVIYAFTEPDANSIGFVSDDEGGARLWAGAGDGGERTRQPHKQLTEIEPVQFQRTAWRNLGKDPHVCTRHTNREE